MSTADLALQRAIEAVKYVARCASIDADRQGHVAIALHLASAMDAADQAAILLQQICSTQKSTHETTS